MRETFDVTLSPKQAADYGYIKKTIAEKLGISDTSSLQVRLIKKSIDARKPNIKVNIRCEGIIDEPPYKHVNRCDHYPHVEGANPVIIVGAGPAGLFAALKLIERGLKPIILERGKDIHDRKKDIAAINRNNGINNESNYCFGEGGAGTFSDGKLYTRSNKRGNIPEILALFVEHGADEAILYEAHPHIGTDKLPVVIENMRKTIIAHGGEIYFNRKLKHIHVKNSHFCGVETEDGSLFEAKKMILATGHSARDIYEWFYHNNYAIEAKPLAIGVRLEHPQELINNIQYHHSKDIPYLPTAAYSIVTQVENRGVFSFCMCPGGTIVPAATGEREIVVNGMSNSKRNSPYANSGIVVQVELEDIPQFSQHGALAFLEYQRMAERKAYIYESLTSPAQRMVDFVKGKTSANLPETTYHPGIASIDMNEVLPNLISRKLKAAFQHWGKTIPGFLTNEATIIGVESRTSSPIRITRNRETLEHVEIKGLYPCGEGAGYAGGIVSSALDGVRIAENINFE